MHPGVLVALAAYFFFCICDAFIKAIGPETSVFQTLFFVTLFSFLPVLAFTLRHDPLSAMFKMNQPWLVMGRAATGILAGMFGFYTFTHLPFAEAYALIFLAPVFVTVLSIFFLGEQVRAWRWTAVAVGLFGVWVVVRPGFREIQVGHLTAILAAMAGAAGFADTRSVTTESDLDRLVADLATPGAGPRLAVIAVRAENLERSMPSRDAVFVKNRFRANLGLAPN